MLWLLLQPPRNGRKPCTSTSVLFLSILLIGPCPLYLELDSMDMERIITQTISQTTELQCLTILLGQIHNFSAAAVTAWLMQTKNSLRHLSFDVRTTGILNIIEGCSIQRLEGLDLAHNSIEDVKPSGKKFPYLKSLTLRFINISALDLSSLLSSCPTLETLSMDSLDSMSDSEADVKLTGSSLKHCFLESFDLKKFTLQTDLLENLHLEHCAFQAFVLIGKQTLKVLKIDDSILGNLQIWENTKNLEILDFCDVTVFEPKFDHVFSKAPKLNRFRKWDRDYALKDDAIVNIVNISICCPGLTHLSVRYDLRHGAPPVGLDGLSPMMNVVVLKLGWIAINDHFSVLVEELVQKCPNLKKLVICGSFTNVTMTPRMSQSFARFIEFIVQLGRRYLQLKFEFEYEY